MNTNYREDELIQGVQAQFKDKYDKDHILNAAWSFNNGHTYKETDADHDLFTAVSKFIESKNLPTSPENGMKKLSDLKALVQETRDAPLKVAEDIQIYMDELIKMTATLNDSSNYGTEYKIEVKPIIENTDMIKDIQFSLIKSSNEMAYVKEADKVLFTCSTKESFYKFDEVNGYERETSPLHRDDTFRKTEEVQFHKGFYDESKLFKEIVEDFMVTAFVKNEKLAQTESKFKGLVSQKSSSLKRTI